MFQANRRVRIGLVDGQSTVIDDVHDLDKFEPVPGTLVQEIWHQSTVPGTPLDDGVRSGVVDHATPPGGALVRVLTVQPTSPEEWTLRLHGDHNRHVLTLLINRVDVVLQQGEVAMTAGDSIVLSGHLHDFRNIYGEPAVLLYTSFSLPAEDEGVAPATS